MSAPTFSLNPYLIFNGNCETAFVHYSKVFNLPITQISRFGEMPSNPKIQLSEIEANKIMHVCIPLANGTTLMGSDTNSSSEKISVGDNFSISINATSVEQADNFFNKLSENGMVKMQIEKTFWNAYFGMLTDQFGINWMINFDFE
ncbi:MAG: hypothetical protein RLZZ312_1710 [Bacteroidota bacterium]